MLRRTSAIILMLTVSVCTFSQSKIKKLYEKVDAKLREKYERVTYDTLYISRPDKKFMLKIKGNLSGNSFRFKSLREGDDTHAYLTTSTRGTLNLGASYMGLSASFSINPGKMSGRNQDYEFNISATSNRYIIDFSFQRSKTLSGHFDSGGETHYLDKEFLKLEMLNLTGFYIFNHRRFSFPAVFSQSYIQRHSAGSWLAGLAFTGSRISTNDGVPEGFPDMDINGKSIAIGGGYGYNLVCRKWLFHLSAMPTIVVYNHKKSTVSGEVTRDNSYFRNGIINSRGAIIYNFGSRYFIGVNAVANSTVFGSSNYHFSRTKWNASAFFGLRL